MCILKVLQTAILIERILRSGHDCALPTSRNGNQWFGIDIWEADTAIDSRSSEIISPETTIFDQKQESEAAAPFH